MRRPMIAMLAVLIVLALATPLSVMIVLLAAPALWLARASLSRAMAGVFVVAGISSAISNALPWETAVSAVSFVLVAVWYAGGRVVNETSVARAHSRARTLTLALAVSLLMASSLRAVPILVSLSWAGVYFALGFSLPRAGPAVSWRTRLANVTLILVSAVLTLGVLEVGVRVVMGPPHLEAMMMHPERISTPRPNGVGTYPCSVGPEEVVRVPYAFSSDGLRNAPLAPKKPGVVRVMALGDSFTFGAGVSREEAYPQQLENVLNARAIGTRYEVVNAGVSNTGPFQEWSFFRDIVDRVNPDIVVQQILLNNDIADDLFFQDKMPRVAHRNFYGPRYLLLHGPHWVVELWSALRAHSALFTLAWDASGASWRLLDPSYIFRFLTPLNYPQPDPSIQRPYSLETSLRVWYDELEEGWALNQRHVLAVRDACAKRGIKYMAFAVPDGFIVSDSLWEGVCSSLPSGIDPELLYERGKNVRIAEEFFESEKIPYARLAPALESSGNADGCYFPFDGHWTPLGCKAVARQVARGLHRVFPDMFPEVEAKKLSEEDADPPITP